MQKIPLVGIFCYYASMKKVSFHIVTLFPEIIRAYAAESILKRAGEKKHISIVAINPRDYTKDKHHKVDDRSYGGGPGMVLKPEPILRSLEKLLSKKGGKAAVFILSPRGEQFTNAHAAKIAKKYSEIILISGRYEGIDARVKKILKAKEISVGPYVVTGGELPALIVVDAIARHIPGVLGKEESLEEKRTTAKEIYTRPEVLMYKGKKYKVPAVLLSGNHAKIEEWKRGKK